MTQGANAADITHTAAEAPGKAGCSIRLEQLTKRFRRVGGELVNAVDGMTLDIEAGQFIVLVGPSGCGKTTLLRCIAGLESPDQGIIRFGETEVFSSGQRLDAPPERRDAAMLFQSYALWPHMTVFDNVAYPLRSKNMARGDIEEHVGAVLKKVQCDQLANQHPGQISGGQQQRVALARALVAGNRIVLFDEPLSNIDAKVRDELRLEILRIQRELGFTAIYVTHDQTEAMTLADRIVVLKEGRIAQMGTPFEVYSRPESPYVARFMGAMNELHGRLLRKSGAHFVYKTEVGDVVADEAPSDSGSVHVLLGFRPTSCSLHADPARAAASDNTIKVEVTTEIFLGTHFEYVVRSGSGEYRCWSLERLSGFQDRTGWLMLPPAGIRVLPEHDAPHRTAT